MSKLQTIDADTLLSTPLPATRFVVERLLPEGLHTMLRPNGESIFNLAAGCSKVRHSA